MFLHGTHGCLRYNKCVYYPVSEKDYEQCTQLNFLQNGDIFRITCSDDHIILWTKDGTKLTRRIQARL